MDHSRRAFLAAAGSALLAGCSGDDDSVSVTPYDATITTRPADSPTPSLTIAGPDPLETVAVPDAAAPIPTPIRERVVDDNPSREPVGVTATGSGIDVIANTRAATGAQPPGRISIDADGSVVGRTSLEGLPGTQIHFLQTVGDTLVVGGHTDDPVRTWLRGYRDGAIDYRYTTPARVPIRFDAINTLEGNILATGATPDRDRSVVARLEMDGTARWIRTWYSAQNRAIRTLTTTPRGLSVGGVSGGNAWLSGLTERGFQQWSRTLVAGERTYEVRRLTSGQTGSYALATSRLSESSPSKLLLFALEGSNIRWVRVFDPRERDVTLRGGVVVDAGGPVLMGDAATENATWLASLTPEGGVRWAGRYRVDDGPTWPSGLALLGDSLVAYGRLPASHMPERSNVWLAWFTP